MQTYSAAGVGGPILATALIVFGIVMAIAWILVPFAILGMKRLLRELIVETKRTNALLEAAARPRVSSDGVRDLDSLRAER